MGNILGNPLKLGMVDGTDTRLVMTPEQRSTHLYVCGSTGTGKSKMLEYLIRQDIANWSLNKCGALIIDPHGSLYNSLINWITWQAPWLKQVPIVPIDLHQTEWTIGYNVLRPRLKADPSVVVSNFVQAMAYVWGASGTDQTPLFARVCSNVLWALYEKKLTLLEAEHLISNASKQIGAQVTEGLTRRTIMHDWAFAKSLSPRDHHNLFSSTTNRFHSFLLNEKLRLMFGQDGASLDLGTALEQGSIIIVNLSTEGGRISEEDGSLFATLLLSDLWTAARERGKGTDARHVKPFYVYIDEFQNFVTPTIAKNLAEARGYGLHLTLANQFPEQIRHSGVNGAQVYASILANARSKIVFETRDEENLRPLALDLFMGVMNPDEIKHQLYSTKVLDYVEETRTVRSKSDGWSSATGVFTGHTGTQSTGGTIYDGEVQDPGMWNESEADSEGTSQINARSGSESSSEVPFQRPVMGKELSSVQFRSLEEQLFRAMAVLHDQQQRHCVVKLTGDKVPKTVVTPTIEETPATPKMQKAFLTSALKKLSFAIPDAQARTLIEDRDKKMTQGAIDIAAEPVSIRRKITEPMPEFKVLPAAPKPTVKKPTRGIRKKS